MQLWEHPATTAALQKRLLRTVLEEVVVNASSDPPRIHLRLHWAGGVHTSLQIVRNTTGHHKRCTDRNVIELAGELAKVCDDRTIAAVLNRLGYRTGHGNTWTLTRVKTMRSHHRIPRFDADEARSWATLEQVARELHVGRHVVRMLIRRGILPAQQVVRCAPWVIERTDLQRPVVQEAIQAIQNGQRLPRHDDAQSQPVLFQQGSEV